VHVSETFNRFTDLHKNAFGDRAVPGPALGAIALPQTSSRYKGKGTEGRERKGLGIGRGGEMGRKNMKG